MKGIFKKMESILKLKLWPGNNIEKYESQTDKVLVESKNLANDIKRLQATVDNESGWCLKMVKQGDDNNDCSNSG